MRDKLNTFIDNTISQFVEVSYSPAQYQCMDLMYLWIFCLDIPKATVQHGSAYQVYSDATDFTRQYFDVIPNLIETIPQAGDLVVWNQKYGTYGHIAMVIEATKYKMKVYEQNNPLGTNAHIQDRSYTNVSGFLRPKIKVEGGIPQYLTTLMQEAGLSLADEGSFRAFWEKAIKYDQDVRTLQEQVKSANEALSDRALEVSTLTEKNQKLSDRAIEAEAEVNRLRGERDKATWELTKANLQVESLQEEVEKLAKEIESFKTNNSIFAYSWFDRFVSLWRR
jgi:hypothetical protein